MQIDRPEIKYSALVAEKLEDGEMKLSVKSLNTRNFPHNDVLVRVEYSSLNYKDALSASGNPGVTKSYPHTPGIDAAGVVEWSDDDRFQEGDEVIVTSYDLGQNTPGGFGQFISVPGDWIVPLPGGLSLKESMMLGTAGFTAAYGVRNIIESGIQPGDGDIVVTGATGGVGSLAVAILSKIGFSVIAVTGKLDQHPFLENLGAKKIVSREEVTGVKSSPMLASRWKGGLDTVGGEMLDALLRQTAHNGVVACCGNVLGGDLHTSIYPFILRGISLMGIDSGICLMKDRTELWQQISEEWKPRQLGDICRECGLEQLKPEIKKILNGEQIGRVLVNLRD